MSLRADLPLNAEGRGQLRESICRIAGLDASASENQEVDALLHRLLRDWRPKAPHPITELVDSLPKRDFSPNERELCRIALYHLIGGNLEKQRNIDLDSPSVQRQSGTTGRHVNFIRGDLVERAVERLIQLTQKEAEKAPKQKKRNANVTGMRGRYFFTAIEPNELVNIVREQLATELALIEKDRPLGQQPITLIDAVMNRYGITHKDIYQSLAERGCPYKPQTEYKNVHERNYTRHSRQFIQDISLAVHEYTPLIKPYEAMVVLRKRLGTSPAQAQYPGDIIAAFMGTHKLSPNAVLRHIAKAPSATLLEKQDTRLTGRMVGLAQGNTAIFSDPMRGSTLNSLIEALLMARDEQQQVEMLVHAPNAEAATETLSPTRTLHEETFPAGAFDVSLRTVAITQHPGKTGVVLNVKDRESRQQFRYFFNVPGAQAETQLGHVREYLEQTLRDKPECGINELQVSLGRKLEEMQLVVPEKRGHFIGF